MPASPAHPGRFRFPEIVALALQKQLANATCGDAAIT
jgi:hypothetical protein